MVNLSQIIEQEDVLTQESKRIRKTREKESGGVVAQYVFDEQETSLGTTLFDHAPREEELDFALYIPEPVYVEKTQSGLEQLVYKSVDMELNKTYYVRWMNEDYALIRTEKEVEIFRFYPDKK